MRLLVRNGVGFAEGEHPVGELISEGDRPAGGPADFDALDSFGFAEAEVQYEGVLGLVGRAATELTELCDTAGGDGGAGPDGGAAVPVEQPQLEPVPAAW